MVYVASEVGVLGDVVDNAANVVAKGRLGPGQVRSNFHDMPAWDNKQAGPVMCAAALLGL